MSEIKTIAVGISVKNRKAQAQTTYRHTYNTA